jgi:4-hydroxy-2-oxoglutarate aldolase
MNTDRLKGVFLPVCTPFKGPDEALDEAAYAANIKSYARSPVAGHLVLGSNGENKSLTFAEQVRVAHIAYENKGANQIIMLCALYESERLVIEFAKAVGEASMDFMTLLAPSYFRSQMTDEVLYGYFSRLADASSVPVLLYNAPKFTGSVLSTELVERLSHHENIAGIKDSGPGDIDRFFHLNRPDFAVMAGSIGFFLKSLEGGCPGGVCSLGNAFPDEVHALYAAFMEGDKQRTAAIDTRLRDASKVLSGAYGVGAVKRAMDWAGLHGGSPRRPLLPMPDDEAKEARAKLVALDLLS